MTNEKKITPAEAEFLKAIEKYIKDAMAQGFTKEEATEMAKKQVKLMTGRGDDGKEAVH